MRTGAVLLLLAALAAAQEAARLRAMAEIMAKREAETYPFAAKCAASELGEFDYATRAGQSIWRGRDHVLARLDRGTLSVAYEPDAALTKWRGRLEDARPFEWPVRPVDFGLEHAGERVSVYLTRPSARILGNARVGDFDCIVVLVDWLQELSRKVEHPLGLWLAVEREYYPVQVVRYASYVHSDGLVAEVLEVDGATYRPALQFIVDELASWERARLPQRARFFDRDGYDDAVVFTLADARFDKAVVYQDFDLPSFMLVHDGRTDGHGLLWMTPVVDIPLTLAWFGIYVLIAGATVYAVTRVRRRHRPKAEEETVWDRLPLDSPR